MKKVLVVEDSLLIHVVLKRLLQDHNLVFCINALDALDILRVDKFDAILVDVILPDINGKILAQKIKSLYDVLIIGISASECRECEWFDHFIPKPFTFSRVQELKTILSK